MTRKESRKLPDSVCVREKRSPESRSEDEEQLSGRAAETLAGSGQGPGP